PPPASDPRSPRSSARRGRSAPGSAPPAPAVLSRSASRRGRTWRGAESASLGLLPRRRAHHRGVAGDAAGEAGGVARLDPDGVFARLREAVPRDRTRGLAAVAEV